MLIAFITGVGLGLSVVSSAVLALKHDEVEHAKTLSIISIVMIVIGLGVFTAKETLKFAIREAIEYSEAIK